MADPVKNRRTEYTRRFGEKDVAIPVIISTTVVKSSVGLLPYLNHKHSSIPLKMCSEYSIHIRLCTIIVIET